MEGIQISNFVSAISEIHPSVIPLPRPPQPGEALVQVHYAAVNYVDLLYAKGKHQNNRTITKPPFTLGHEFSGVIVALGSNGDGINKGGLDTLNRALKIRDKVFGSGIGAYAEYILVPQRAISHIPEGWSLANAATLDATATVAYGAIVRGDARNGDTVLIHGAAGGIGAYSCQIAKALGLQVIAGVRRKDNTDKVRFLTDNGCIDKIIQTSDDSRWENEVMEATSGRGVDLVIDNVGLVQRSLRTLKPLGGKIIVVGFAGRDENTMESIPVNRILLRQAQVVGYRHGATDRLDPQKTRQARDGLISLIEKGLVKPVTYERPYLGFSDIPRALLDLESGRTWGKIVVRIVQDGPRPTL